MNVVEIDVVYSQTFQRSFASRFDICRFSFDLEFKSEAELGG